MPATLEKLIFGNRLAIVVVFALLTVGLAVVAVRGLHIDASFTKQLPLKHEYMQTFVKHQAEFGGANRVLIALVARDGNMFTPGFFDALKKATDEVLVMDGIDRGRVQSLFTPNVRYMEVVEDGIEAGNVVDSEFVPTPEALAKVRENILKAGIRGRLVANDFSGALVSAIVLEKDATGKPIDPIEVARDLESRVRDKIQGNDVLVQAQGSGVDVHMIGFAKVVGDIADGAMSVIVFAIVTILLTLLAVWYYVQSLKVAVVPIVCSIVAVTWQLGTLVLLGYGIDPLGLLVPFLIFAIGVSHGVQKISAVKEAAVAGVGSMDAARQTFRQLLMPAIIALLADLVGFITILLIPVQVVQEMAVTASIGVAIVILTDLILLPVLVSWVKWDDQYRARVEKRQATLTAYWSRLARITERKPAAIIIGISVLLGIFGVWKGRETPIGDTQAGVPELRADSRYNRDSNIITTKFSIGVDILTVIVETKEPACTSHELMTAIDTFAWKMRNVDGVQEVMALPIVAKIAIAGWNEGSLKWRNIPREPNQLTQSTRYIETSTGLLNADCNVIPGDAVPARSQGRDHRARGRRGEGVAHAQHHAGRHLQSRHGQRRRHGRHQRGSEGQGISHPRLGVRRRHPHVPAHVPQLVRHGAGVPAARARVHPGLRRDGHRRHRAQGQYAAHGGARRRHRRRLRHLPVEPHAGIPARRRRRAAGVREDHARDRRQHHLHRHHARHRRRHLGVLAAAVPGRHRHHAHVHVLREHAGRHHPAAGAGRVAREAEGGAAVAAKRGQPSTRNGDDRRHARG